MLKYSWKKRNFFAFKNGQKTNKKNLFYNTF